MSSDRVAVSERPAKSGPLSIVNLMIQGSVEAFQLFVLQFSHSVLPRSWLLTRCHLHEMNVVTCGKKWQQDLLFQHLCVSVLA